MDQKAIIAIAKEYIAVLSKEKYAIHSAFLFGSYAKNKANNDSDIDVALVSTVFNGFGYEDRKHFSKINIKKQFVDIETKTFPSTYFEKGDPFIAEIIQTGIELYNSKMNKIPTA